MTEIETQEIIDILKIYYPGWEADVKELSGWAKRLLSFDFKKAKFALENYYFEDTKRYQRPSAGKIMAILKEKALIKRERNEETVMTNFYIECIEAPERNPRLIGAKKGVFAANTKNQSDPDYMLKASETMRRHYEQDYGGKWIVVQHEQEEDSGLVGAQARDKAFADILNGPDDKTKQWLTGFLEKKYKEKIEGPESIGSILEKGVF